MLWVRSVQEHSKLSLVGGTRTLSLLTLSHWWQPFMKIRFRWTLLRVTLSTNPTGMRSLANFLMQAEWSAPLLSSNTVSAMTSTQSLWKSWQRSSISRNLSSSVKSSTLEKASLLLSPQRPPKMIKTAWQGQTTWPLSKPFTKFWNASMIYWTRYYIKHLNSIQEAKYLMHHTLIR